MGCDCGNVHDRDKNSNVNVLSRFLSQNALWMRYHRFVGNLRKAGLPTPTLEVHSQEAPCVSVGSSLACLTDAGDEIFAGDAFFRWLFRSWFLGEVVYVFWAAVCV